MLSFLISLLAFAFVITVLVFIHELGHYLAARSVGMRVEKFSVGFPPRFLSFTSKPKGWDFKLFFYKKNEHGKLIWAPVYNKFISSPKKKGTNTEYCLALLPLGGYVKVSGILDESMDPNSTGADYEYQSKKTWQKLWFTSAGVIFNFILSFIILAFIYMSSGYSTNKIGGTIESVEVTQLENIEISLSDNKFKKLDLKDSFTTNIIYSPDTRIDTINDVVRIDKGKTNLVLHNLKEKNIGKIRFKLPDGINKIDSIIIANDKISIEKINDEKSLFEFEVLGDNKILSNPFLGLVTIYHNQVKYENSPAFQVGLKKGDRIISIDGEDVSYFTGVQNTLSEKAETDFVLAIENCLKNINNNEYCIRECGENISAEECTKCRQNFYQNCPYDLVNNSAKIQFELVDNLGNTKTLNLKPKLYNQYNVYKDLESKYKIGFYPDTEKLGFFESFYRSGYEVIYSKNFGILTTFKNIFCLITGQLSLDLMSGPIGIAKISGEVASSGEGWFLSLIQLMAFLSISLGVINILPLPGLDGGHALIAIIEKIKGGRLSAKLQVRIQQIGMLMLMTLFVIIIFKDLLKIF